MATEQKTKWTPGPWMVATSCSWRRIVAADGTPVCEPTVHPVDRHPDLHFRNGGEDGPDARLIAAAPEMYEALLEVQDFLANAELGEFLAGASMGLTTDAYSVSARVAAALAQATGEGRE